MVFVFYTLSWSITGDFDRDGDIDLYDLFLLADNFGKTGLPSLAANYATEIVTVYDTAVFGREEIRYAEPPPLGDISQSIKTKDFLL